MNNTMKTRRMIFGLLAAGCITGMELPPRAAAEVSDADFNALKETVQKLADQLHSLQQTNLIEEQTHEKDVQELQQLQAKLAETQQTAADAEQKTVAAAQTQPLPRVPIDEATVNHNFQILGDAEFQYDKASGQKGSFLLADFAPIFLYRGGDNILF